MTLVISILKSVGTSSLQALERDSNELFRLSKWQPRLPHTPTNRAKAKILISSLFNMRSLFKESFFASLSVGMESIREYFEREELFAHLKKIRIIHFACHGLTYVIQFHCGIDKALRGVWQFAGGLYCQGASTSMLSDVT